MPPGWIVGPVTVTTGQPVTGWVDLRGLANWKAVLYNNETSLSGKGAHMILEVAEELDGSGNPVKSEILAQGSDIPAAAGGQVTYVQQHNIYNYARVSATGDGPGYASTSVSAGITGWGNRSGGY